MEITIYVRGKDGAAWELITCTLPAQSSKKLCDDWSTYTEHNSPKGGAYIYDNEGEVRTLFLRFDEVIAIK